ncbi:MAG: hypothetical protein J7M19_06845, partial [Planctomycetes bacterium]|nr:hypothetical protein [Planctomycetota bacterium]
MSRKYYEQEAIDKVGGRFKLTSLLKKRYKELMFGDKPLVRIDSDDVIDVLLAEVMEDKIELVPEAEAIAAAAAALTSEKASKEASVDDETATARKALLSDADGESKEPDKETKEPDEETKEPDEETKEPDEETKEPDKETKEPDEETKEPDEETKEPDEETKEPDE